jgi:mRNA-degrading endonuclease toxin of MazEF toxin-antitoxin module
MIMYSFGRYLPQTVHDHEPCPECLDVKFRNTAHNGRITARNETQPGRDVVSNDRRNRAFEQALAARLTTTPPRDERPAMVPLGRGEIMTGWVSRDDIEVLYDDEVRADLGAVTVPTMRRVEAGLRAALGMAD